MPRKQWHYIGLSSRDWYKLNHAVLEVALSQGEKQAALDQLPRRLRSHPVARQIDRYLETKRQRYLDEAATMLSGGCSEPWLFLSKS